MRKIIKIIKSLKPVEWLLIALCVGFIAFQVWLDLKMPDYMKEITRLIQTPNSKMSDIWINGGFMMLCALGSLVGAIVVSFVAARISSNLAQRLRHEVYEKVENFSMEEIGKFSTSSLITRSTNDVNQVQMIVAMGIQVLIKAPILAVWAIAKIANKNWQWSLTTLIAVLVMMLLIGIVVVFALPKFKIIQKLTDNLNSVTRENLSGVRVVRAYNAEKYQEEKFSVANENLTKTNLFTGKLMSILMPGITLVLNGLSLAIYWVGAYIIDAAELTNKIVAFSDMVIFMSYAIQVVSAFMLLVFFSIMLPRAVISAKRIGEVLNTTPKIIDGDLTEIPAEKGKVEFKNVSFKYPDAQDYILKNISFSAEQGETIAFIGSTGSGKSTLINLIPRFYDATDGEILIDGVNVKNYKQADLHNKIGYISQRAVIFTGDIKSNISFGESLTNEITDEDVENASSVAQAEEFVNSMPEGYSSHISQGGTNLSGGQKQRLAIARAVARKPEFFIFDDSFSALDYKTDKALREALSKLENKATTFIVAQRIGTIRNADKIIVLDSGKVVGMGKHQELMKNCAVYKEIALSQLSKEELN